MKRFHVHVHLEDLDKGIGSLFAAEPTRAGAADVALLDEGQTPCCCARNGKHWVTDPQGIAWEHSHMLDNIPVFREAAAQQTAASACCTPTPRGKPVGIPVESQSTCC